MATTTNLNSLVINYLTQAQYEAAAEGGTLNENQLYLTPSEVAEETDPVFSASPAAGISTSDISNWNAKVSDDKTWNGVELDKSWNTSASSTYVPHFTSPSATSAKLTKASCTPEDWAIAKYNDGYLNSTTPSANDNSTKVATTAYVDGALNNITTTSTQLIRWTEV